MHHKELLVIESCSTRSLFASASLPSVARLLQVLLRLGWTPTGQYHRTLSHRRARSEAVVPQHPAAALLAAAERKDSQASRGRLPVCQHECGPCVCLGCVGVRRGSLPGGVQHAVNRALLRYPRSRKKNGTSVRAHLFPSIASPPYHLRGFHHPREELRTRVSSWTCPTVINARARENSVARSRQCPSLWRFSVAFRRWCVASADLVLHVCLRGCSQVVLRQSTEEASRRDNDSDSM